MSHALQHYLNVDHWPSRQVHVLLTLACNAADVLEFCWSENQRICKFARMRVHAVHHLKLQPHSFALCHLQLSRSAFLVSSSARICAECYECMLNCLRAFRGFIEVHEQSSEHAWFAQI